MRKNGHKTLTWRNPNGFRAILEARESELSQHLRNREDLVVKAVPDEMDEACHAAERELAIRNLEHIPAS